MLCWGSSSRYPAGMWRAASAWLEGKGGFIMGELNAIFVFCSLTFGIRH